MVMVILMLPPAVAQIEIVLIICENLPVRWIHGTIHITYEVTTTVK